MKNPIKTLTNLYLTLLLSISLLAFCTISIWLFKPSLISVFDEWAVQKYVNHYKERLNGAMKKPPVERKQSLDRLIVTLESVKKLDRLSPIKRQTFLSLINMSMAKDEHDNAVYWTDKWIEFDEKDLVAKLKKGQILYGIPGRKSEGRLILKELNSRYPDVKKISDNYTKMMEIEGY